MTTKYLRNKCILKRAKQIKALLKTDVSYSKMSQRIEKIVAKTTTVNFLNSKYSSGNQHRFPYSWESALLIIDCCQYYTTSYDLLLNNYFKDELNIHSSIESLETEDVEINYEEIDILGLHNSKFGKSNLNQKDYYNSLKISNWKYEDFVVSAIYFHIEELYKTYLKRKKTSKNKSFYELKAFSSDVGLLLLNTLYGKKLFITLENTNLFVTYPDCWLYGFRAILRSCGSDTIKSYERQDRLLFFKNTTSRFPVNFSHISFFLKAFSSFIPLSVINPVYKYCYLTKSVHVLYYILKTYEILL